MADVLPLRICPDDAPADPAGSPLVVDARRLAVLLGCGLRTLRTWDSAGKLPAPVRIGADNRSVSTTPRAGCCRPSGGTPCRRVTGPGATRCGPSSATCSGRAAEGRPGRAETHAGRGGIDPPPARVRFGATRTPLSRPSRAGRGGRTAPRRPWPGNPPTGRTARGPAAASPRSRRNGPVVRPDANGRGQFAGRVPRSQCAESAAEQHGQAASIDHERRAGRVGGRVVGADAQGEYVSHGRPPSVPRRQGEFRRGSGHLTGD